MNRTAAVKNSHQATPTTLPALPTTGLVPGPVRPGDRLLVSVGEALWRSGWDMDRASFMTHLERRYPDALVMTGKGVRVDLIQLLNSTGQQGPVALPVVTVNGPVEFDTLR